MSVSAGTFHTPTGQACRVVEACCSPACVVTVGAERGELVLHLSAPQGSWEGNTELS